MKKQNIEEVKSTSVNSIIEKVIPQPSAEQIGQESWLRNNLLLDKVETGLIKARFQGIEKVVVPVSPKAAKLLTSNLSWKEHLSDSMAPVKECTIIIPRETNVVGGKQTNLSLQEDQLSVMSSANKRGVEKIKVIFSSNSDKYIH
ncbi:hypothetical protein [Candidatus Trichorickettsia mobilis]|uniref:hypothetical protein n=1 Tax=Candidatus Trichorickettsia mobilis TaxID=1346319 RepID=UPI00292EDBD1|nr:hypothetical protein [Candidatus Trichorickettsia mobilis]